MPFMIKRITTPVQANFHLEKGDLLVFHLSKYNCIYVVKDFIKKDNYEIALVPVFGETKIYEGPYGFVKKMIEEYDFIAIDRASIDARRPGYFDKFYHFINSIFTMLFGKKH
jgi:hypothetical protein